MKRLLLISLLSLGCLSNLEAFFGIGTSTGAFKPVVTYDLMTNNYPSYDSYIAAVDSGNFNPFGQVGSGSTAVSGLDLVVQKEGQNSYRAQMIRDARATFQTAPQ